MTEPTTPPLPANKIAFIIDGKVQDVFHTDDRLAAILLSEPIILNVTQYYEGKEPSFNIINWNYDGETLSEVHNVVQVIDETAPQDPTVITL